MKGLTAPPIKNKVALRVSLTGSVFMDSVRVGHDALLPKTKGLGSPFSCLNSARCASSLSHLYSVNHAPTQVRYRLGCNGRA